jgi:hypothetical protein
MTNPINNLNSTDIGDIAMHSETAGRLGARRWRTVLVLPFLVAAVLAVAQSGNARAVDVVRS